MRPHEALPLQLGLGVRLLQQLLAPLLGELGEDQPAVGGDQGAKVPAVGDIRDPRSTRCER